MSMENVGRFYSLLEVDADLKKAALSLKMDFADQESVIEAFVRLASENGLDFTSEELVAYIYSKAE